MKNNATCPLVDGPIDTSAPSPTSEKPTLTRLRFVLVYQKTEKPICSTLSHLFYKNEKTKTKKCEIKVPIETR